MNSLAASRSEQDPKTDYQQQSIHHGAPLAP
jgi:hypothetical protein